VEVFHNCVGLSFFKIQIVEYLLIPAVVFFFVSFRFMILLHVSSVFSISAGENIITPPRLDAEH